MMINLGFYTLGSFLELIKKTNKEAIVVVINFYKLLMLPPFILSLTGIVLALVNAMEMKFGNIETTG